MICIILPVICFAVQPVLEGGYFSQNAPTPHPLTVKQSLNSFLVQRPLKKDHKPNLKHHLCLMSVKETFSSCMLDVQQDTCLVFVDSFSYYVM